MNALIVRCLIAVTIAVALTPFAMAAESKRKEKPATPTSAFDPASFPVLKGTITSVAGHFNTFGRPGVGDRATLVLTDLLRPKAVTKEVRQPVFLRFSPAPNGRRTFSYISLPGDLSIESVKVDAKAGFRRLRLNAGDEGSRTRMDFAYVPGKGMRCVEVWIINEYQGVTRGVLLIECEPHGDFPKLKLNPAARPGDGQQRSTGK